MGEPELDKAPEEAPPPRTFSLFFFAASCDSRTTSDARCETALVILP